MLCVSLLKKCMYKWTESRGIKTKIKVFLVQNMWNVVKKKPLENTLWTTFKNQVCDYSNSSS